MQTDFPRDHGFQPAAYTILIADDHVENLRILDEYLKEQGFHTIIASRGELVFQRLQHIRPDLILLDVMMPDMDGFEACRRLKARDATRDIPVIFMTALTETEYKIKGFEAGAVDYITKPLQQQEVLLRVTTHLRIRQEITERQRAEAALRAAHQEIVRLEKAALEVKMAGGFAHEMRNALAGIQLALHRVQVGAQTLCEQNVDLLGQLWDELTPLIPPGQWDTFVSRLETVDRQEAIVNHVLQLIAEYTRRALDVTTVILDYARIGSAEPGHEPVSLTQIVSATIQAHTQEFEAQQIAIRAELTATRMLQGSASHFYMIINNILLNARDALLEVADGRARQIDITVTETAQEQCLRLTDNANGIPEEHVAKIFDPFFSTKPTTGTGLGLSVVAKLVPMYHGTIHVTSVMGQGTMLTIRFPLPST